MELHQLLKAPHGGGTNLLCLVTGKLSVVACNQQTNHPTNHSPNHPPTHPTNQPATQPTNQPTTKPTNTRTPNQPTNQQTTQPPNQPTNQPPNQPSKIGCTGPIRPGSTAVVSPSLQVLKPFPRLVCASNAECVLPISPSKAIVKLLVMTLFPSTQLARR